MKRLTQLMLLTGLLLFGGSMLAQQELSAKEIIKKADDKTKGEESGIGVMTMQIVRPDWTRTVQFRTWSKGTESSLTLITSPAKEKGQTFLKRGNEMWNWNPKISRMIKLPPSLMSQGWMGSDYTNDDILKESSIVKDYNHELIGSEEIDGHECYKIKMIAKEEANVVWGSQVRWIDKKEFMILKAELYDEEDYLIRTEVGLDMKLMDGRMIPSRMEIIPAEEEGHKTVVIIDEIKFNKPIEDSFFSQQNMKRVR
jgi:outer membrane lipoprotein-sorting protein